ncbi:MAG TPA: RNA polymerase sigma factor RpoD/SigA [Candidatus Polarisedimenticolia bacterium]|jgi:RNA polymerase primary sigma factor|nr:RNA polymerase sigma factor RpoD/SigA [Candidatus Polarisedimenticolia bacterium]
MMQALPSHAGEEADSLITSHLRFVAHVARDYRNMGLAFEDLVNEGNVGLVEAARRFDPARGVTFASYAVWWIRKSILKAVARNAHIVHIPEYQRQRMRDARNTKRVLERALGREPGREEISRALDVPVARVDQLLRLQFPWTLSLEDTVREAGDTTVLDRLADDRSVSPEEELSRRQDRARLRQALRSLGDRERSVIIDRFGLGDGPVLTLREIAEKLGVSRETVRQIEFQARRRLRKGMAHRVATRTTAANQPVAHQGTCVPL